MKRSLKTLAIPAAVALAGLLLTPMLALLPRAQQPELPPDTSPELTDSYTGEGFLVLDLSDGRVMELTEYEYVLGSVLSEMPASYGEEALKAQAVASHTYALLLRQNARQNGEPEGGADFSVDSSLCQGYMDPADAESYLGTGWEDYLKKVEDAVSEVIDEALYCDGQLVSACYHAISPGRTEDSGNVFAVSVPYLSPVDSSWDRSAAGYLSTASFDPYTLDSLLKLQHPDYQSQGEPDQWLGEMEATESGTVLWVEFCGQQFKGTEIREALGLRSAAFDLQYSQEEGFVFTVYGYGHGVGMSQVGAGYLADEGWSYQEILAHYYTGAELKEIEEA